MKQWIMMVGGFLSWIPASLFSQTLWVTSLDSIDLDKSVADLKDCYAVEFLLEAFRRSASDRKFLRLSSTRAFDGYLSVGHLETRFAGVAIGRAFPCAQGLSDRPFFGQKAAGADGADKSF